MWFDRIYYVISYPTGKEIFETPFNYVNIFLKSWDYKLIIYLVSYHISISMHLKHNILKMRTNFKAFQQIKLWNSTSTMPFESTPCH